MREGDTEKFHRVRVFRFDIATNRRYTPGIDIRDSRFTPSPTEAREVPMTIACHRTQSQLVPNRHALTHASESGMGGSKPWAAVIRTQCDFAVRLPVGQPKGFRTRRGRG